jgi:hypothetical protein
MKNDPSASSTPFLNLVMLLGSSAMQQLGQPLGPNMEKQAPDLRAAEMTIDMLVALEAKSKGNLTEEEARILKDTLYSLRTLFVGVRGKLGRDKA